ncbi:MAG: hypothetical protein ACRCS7_05050 [Tannerellaceae bacterium]
MHIISLINIEPHYINRGEEPQGKGRRENLHTGIKNNKAESPDPAQFNLFILYHLKNIRFQNHVAKFALPI